MTVHLQDMAIGQEHTTWAMCPWCKSICVTPCRMGRLLCASTGVLTVLILSFTCPPPGVHTATRGAPKSCTTWT